MNEERSSIGPKFKILWKSMRAGLKSQSGSIIWKIGKWFKEEGELKLGSNGFHACANIVDAMCIGGGNIIAKVKVSGVHKTSNYQQCWAKMKIEKAWAWGREDFNALRIFIAELYNGKFCIELDSSSEEAADWHNICALRYVFYDPEIKAKCHDFVLDRLKTKKEISL